MGLTAMKALQVLLHIAVTNEQMEIAPEDKQRVQALV